MDDSKIPEININPMDHNPLGIVVAATFSAAAAFPSLLERSGAGEFVDPGELERARSAHDIVQRVADLLTIASQLLGDQDIWPCGVCQVRYRNLMRIPLVLCSDHCRGPVPDDSVGDASPPSGSRTKEVLAYLSRMFGHERDLYCAECSVEVAGLSSNPLSKDSVGEGPLRNGVLLVFNLCKLEYLT